MTTKRLSAQERLLKLLPDTLRATLTIRLFGLTKIPLLLYVRPSVVEISDEKVVVKIPLKRRTRNHLRAMYFGALAMGADCAGGLIAMQQIMESGENIALLFKNLSAEFLKRAEGDVYFTCTEGGQFRTLSGKPYTRKTGSKCPCISPPQSRINSETNRWPSLPCFSQSRKNSSPSLYGLRPGRGMIVHAAGCTEVIYNFV